jgi:RNA polymerase sigma factor (sigma-70 family)
MTVLRAGDEPELAALVARAQGGERAALEQVVAAVQDDVFRLALRMTAHPQDAEDAAQEVLIKIVTRLDGFRGQSSLKTWAYRIAANHLLDRKKSRVEALVLDFRSFGDDLLDGLSAEPDPDPLLAEQVKLGCTLAMLTCLDRQHRLAFILGEVFDLPHDTAAEVCEVSEETYRQRLSRSRLRLEAFTRSFCGIVNAEAPCSCGKRVARAEELGRIERAKREHGRALPIATREMEALHATARLMRSHPTYVAPQTLLDNVRAALGGKLQLDV